MAGNKDHFETEEEPEFSDEMIRRFLLGELSAFEQPLFEQSLFTNDDLDARVRLAELDLTDDYAFGRLSAPDRRLFEQRFLVTAGRQQKLQVSQVLRDRFSTDTAAKTEEGTFAQRLKHVLGFERRAWRLAFGVLILLILLGTAWLVIKEPRIAEQITKKFIPQRSSPPGAPRSASHPTNTSIPDHQNTPSPMPVHDQGTAPLIVNIALAQSASPQTSVMTALNLPKGDQDVVRLQLAVKSDQAGPYRAELVTEGSSVFSADSLKPADSAVVDFDIPARVLKAGDYQVKLSQGGSSDLVAGYYFRVQ
jgi:hypothetical protein